MTFGDWEPAKSFDPDPNRIVGGTNASMNEFPFIGSIQIEVLRSALLWRAHFEPRVCGDGRAMRPIKRLLLHSRIRLPGSRAPSSIKSSSTKPTIRKRNTEPSTVTSGVGASNDEKGRRLLTEWLRFSSFHIAEPD